MKEKALLKEADVVGRMMMMMIIIIIIV